jgi:hypothetical protein
MKQMTAPMTVNAPGRSIWRTFSLSDAFAGAALAGVEKKRRMIPAEIPPMGRLM